MKNYIRRKILIPLSSFLTKGMSVEKMSLTLSLGICFGIMPFLGVTTYLLVLLAVIFKLNIPALQLVNYALSAVQIILYAPFLKLSQLIFFQGKQDFQFNQITEMYRSNFLVTLKAVWHLNLGALFIWAILAIPMGIAIYYLSQPIMIRHKLKFATAIL